MTRRAVFAIPFPSSHHIFMGQQYNKGIKKKRRIAYLKRKKAAVGKAKTKK